jgi:hypothetical protein
VLYKIEETIVYADLGFDKQGCVTETACFGSLNKLKFGFDNTSAGWMKLKKILIRYYPPGITLEYIRSNGEVESKCIDLLNLSEETNIDELIT